MNNRKNKNNETSNQYKYRTISAVLAVLLVVVMAVQCGYWGGLIRPCSRSGADAGSDQSEETVNTASLTRSGYTLDQVVVLSRHNIRSPLSGGGSVLGDITPHEWFPWSSDPSELSIRGGSLETEMGQFFRKWLESEELFEKNEKPGKNEVRFYANSKQRTIATARFFSTGLLPTANQKVEYHAEFDKMDPVFKPQLTFVSDEYNADAEKQVTEMFTEKIKGLSDNYSLLADVIDMKQSAAWKDGTVKEFRTDDTKLNLVLNDEPTLTGSLKTACAVSDALVLQYYEETDSKKAAFGKALTKQQWEDLAEVKDVYQDMLFTAPLIASNVAHPLLQEIQKELNTDGRKFTFLCGHDSNVGSVLSALGAEDYSLLYTIEKKTPIGCKLVFCRWHNKDSKKYCSLNLVYQTVDQLRGLSLLDLANPPAAFPIKLKGLDYTGEGLSNNEGVYDEDAFMAHLQDAIKEYDKITKKYAPAKKKAA